MLNDEESRKVDQDFFNAIGVEETGISLDDNESLDEKPKTEVTQEIVDNDKEETQDEKPKEETKTEETKPKPDDKTGEGSKEERKEGGKPATETSDAGKPAEGKKETKPVDEKAE